MQCSASVLFKEGRIYYTASNSEKCTHTRPGVLPAGLPMRHVPRPVAYFVTRCSIMMSTADSACTECCWFQTLVQRLLGIVQGGVLGDQALQCCCHTQAAAWKEGN